jgi:uncharacterized protein (TIGR02466 family)
MTIDYEISPLFPTPLLVFSDFITEEERVKIYDSIKKVNHLPHTAISGNGTSSHGQKVVDFLDRKIKERIQSALDEYSNEYGCYKVQIEVDSIWSNIQMKGSVLTEHSHPNSLLSGALYINANDNLFFHNPNPYVYFTPKDKATIFNNEYTKFPVKNCQLLIFPSWLRHGKNDLINEMDDRVVVSFNASSK